MKTPNAKFMTALGALSGVALAAGLATPGAAGAAAGNGIASKPANQIVTTALQAMQSVTSLTISGVIHQGRETLGLNVTASSSGEGQGTVTMNGLKVNVASTGSTVYMKAGAGFWRASGAPAAAATQLAGRWISLSLSDAGASSIASALNSGTFLRQLPKTSDAGTAVAKVGTGTLNGQPVVKLKAANPNNPNDNGVMYVATTGAPYVLRVAGSGRSSFGIVDFSHYNQAVNVQPPSGAVSISQLEQQG